MEGLWPFTLVFDGQEVRSKDFDFWLSVNREISARVNAALRAEGWPQGEDSLDEEVRVNIDAERRISVLHAPSRTMPSQGNL
jgi:hypothetical protein